MNQLLAIPPDHLGKIWHEIRHEIAEIEAPDDFIPEDVYWACKTNQATLFFLMVDDKRVGWMVARQQLPAIHIWQLHAENGYDVLRAFRAELMTLVRNANCSKITYGSTRKAWQKVAPDHGFKMQMVIWECPLDPLPQPPAPKPPTGEDGTGAGN